MYEEAWKQVRRRDADMLMLMRAAHHAEDIKKISSELTKFDRKMDLGLTPQQFINAMKGMG